MKNKDSKISADQKKISDHKAQPIKVTNDNALPLAVKYLELIFARLGYIIKLYEQKEVVKK